MLDNDNTGSNNGVGLVVNLVLVCLYNNSLLYNNLLLYFYDLLYFTAKAF